MKQILYCNLIISFALCNCCVAQDIAVFSRGEISKTDHHTGSVWLNELKKPDSILNYSIALATFAPGAKLDWHKHPAGQSLLITEGIGYYQEDDSPIQIVYKGDVIKCLPGVAHWHGATPQSNFAYIAITPAQNGKTLWLQRVTDEAYNKVNAGMSNKTPEQEIISLSKQKWLWMAERNVDSLNKLFDEKAVFVHMGGIMSKEQELAVIKTGNIQYKHAHIQETTLQIIGNTAILLNKIRLTAIVGGNEVINPFVVTEVYVNKNNAWLLVSMSFTKLLAPEDTKR